jgi:hypothetical protein
MLLKNNPSKLYSIKSNDSQESHPPGHPWKLHPSQIKKIQISTQTSKKKKRGAKLVIFCGIVKATYWFLKCINGY